MLRVEEHKRLIVPLILHGGPALSLCRVRHRANARAVQEKQGEPFVLQGGRLAGKGTPPLSSFSIFFVLFNHTVSHRQPSLA